MNEEEAIKIARAISIVDGGCIECVKEICEELNESALGFDFNPTDEIEDRKFISRLTGLNGTQSAVKIIITKSSKDTEHG